INKYGKDNFIIKEIDYAQSQEELNKLEIYYIKKFNSLWPNGYNLRKGGKNGGKFTNKSRQKNSQAHKIKFKTDNKYRQHILDNVKIMCKINKGSISKRRKKIIGIHIDTLEVIKLSHTWEDDRFDGDSVGRCCLNKRISHKNHVWQYVNDLECDHNSSNEEILDNFKELLQKAENRLVSRDRYL
ncbi:MAG: hypothetical protein R3321_10765, partial [Nitrososphaeraceae archaeon]|nr:hypothetical protein [Nitrososphaeraceae archaeon]